MDFLKSFWQRPIQDLVDLTCVWDTAIMGAELANDQYFR
jgi:hypothetical protein